MTSSITLNLSERFSERYAWAQPEGIKLTTDILCEVLWLKIRVTHYCYMIICIFCSSHYSHVWVGTEVNVQSQISSFISLDGIWKELVSWEKIMSFFDHSNTCAGFQLVECSVSWEIALWFSLWEPDWSFTWERICNPLSQEQPVL